MQNEKDEIKELVEGVGSLNIQKDGEAPLPHNWPSDLVYTSSLIWDEITPEFKTNFEDTIQITPMVEVHEFIGEEDGEEVKEEVDKKIKIKEYGVMSKVALAEGVWLGEYSGEVQNIVNVEDDTFSFFLYETPKDKNNKSSQYVVDASKHGNELRYLRKTSTDYSNCRLYRIWVDGTIRLFLQVTKEIAGAGEELLLDEEEESNNYPISLPNPKKRSEEEIQKLKEDYSYTIYPIYDHNDELLSKEEQELLTKKKNLSELGTLKIIENSNHPCYQQLGLFAEVNIRNGVYIGEYTGRVLTHVEEPFSRYLVDFSNPHSPGCDKVWADALLEGNETRYINDNKNTGFACNVTFRKMFLNGYMRVYVQAILDIEKGEEIFVDYGDGYWDNMPEAHLPSNEFVDQVQQ